MNKITSINTGFLSFIVEPVILVYFVISITFIGNSIELFKESLKGIDLGGLDFISGIVGILPKEIEKLATITLIANFLLTIYSIINLALLIKNKKMQTN